MYCFAVINIAIYRYIVILFHPYNQSTLVNYTTKQNHDSYILSQNITRIPNRIVLRTYIQLFEFNNTSLRLALDTYNYNTEILWQGLICYHFANGKKISAELQAELFPIKANVSKIMWLRACYLQYIVSVNYILYVVYNYIICISWLSPVYHSYTLDVSEVMIAILYLCAIDPVLL